MHRYRTYMDQISLSPQQHQRLLAALKARPSQKRRPQAYRALAACACLALALLAGRYILSSPLSQPTQSPAYTPAALGQPYQLLTFTDRTGEPQPSLDLAFPLGNFQEELSRQEWLDILGCAPFWEEAWPGSTLTACAIYDGEGQIWEVRLSGDTPAGESFYLRLAPGALPPECALYEGGADNLVEGVTVHADYRHWDRDGDGDEEYVYTASFLTESVGVRLEVQTGDSSGAQLASAGVSAMLTGSGLTLDHLRPEEIPEWRSEELTLSQARDEEGLGQYLPQALPEGFSFQEAHRELGQGRDWLSALWCRGYDDIHIWVSRPEVSPQVMEVSNTAYYDVNLYSIPWADSVPHEVLFGGFQDPVFRFEDLTQEVISARARYVEGDQGDTPGWRFSQFSVLHPDGVLVRYNLRGLTPQQATQLILGN
jgi:hypothetical protein